RAGTGPNAPRLPWRDDAPLDAFLAHSAAPKRIGFRSIVAPGCSGCIGTKLFGTYWHLPDEAFIDEVMHVAFVNVLQDKAGRVRAVGVNLVTGAEPLGTDVAVCPQPNCKEVLERFVVTILDVLHQKCHPP